MFKLKLIICISIFFLLFLGYFHPISAITQDLGRHLATGNIIIQTHTVPKTNLFSYTYPDFPFVNHHWLSEVFYNLLFQKIGFNGLLLFNTALILLSFGLIIFSIYKKAGSLALLFCSLLYIPILFERTDVRPEIFSFLFLSLFIFILYRFREKFTRLIFLLPILELLWVNMHIYFPIGIALILFFLIETIISRIKNPNTKARNPKPSYAKASEGQSKFLILLAGRSLWRRLVSSFDIRISSLLFVLFASALITFLNPNGLKGALYPFSVFQNYGYAIQENQNIFFLWNYSRNQAILFFGIGVALLFSFLTLTIKKTHPIDWLISIFFAILAASAIRNFPLFVFATFIPFVRSSSNLRLFSLHKNLKYAFLIFLSGLFLFEAQQTFIKKGFGFGVEKGAENGVNFFLENNLKGPIFNNFDIGSYLIYRLHPKEKVFIDGRPEAYPASFFKEEYVPMQQDSILFEKLDQKYNFNTIFFSHTDQTPWAETFLKQITQNNKWNMVYLDDFTVIFTHDKNLRPIIKTDYSGMQSLIQLAHFFQNKNLGNEEIKIYQKILNINPNYCPALYNLALKLQDKKDPSFSIFANKFQQNCQ